jgi:hypothetical protein
MHVIALDLLTDMRDLPPAAPAVLACIGSLLWAFGWRGYRFWIVLATTLGAGLFGLRVGNDMGIHPIAAGLLCAVAAGCLALSLVKAAVFGATGLTCWYVMGIAAPQFSSPLLCILGGGLIGLIMFRLCVILLTSAAGTLFLSYGGLLLAERAGKFNSVRWVQEHGQLVDIGFLVTVFFGVVFQYCLERAVKRYQTWRAQWKEMQEKLKTDTVEKKPATIKKWLPAFFRKAG